MPNIIDVNGAIVSRHLNDAEAVREWLNNGHANDILSDTREEVADVVCLIFPHATWQIDQHGEVIYGDTGEDDDD